MLELRTLGDLRITVDGRPAALHSHKAQALLVYLAIEGEPQPRSSLAALLWPESDQEHANTSLRVALTTLNKSCRDYLNCNRQRIGIDWDKPVCADLNELLHCAEKAEDDRAQEFYKGPFLAGFHIRDSEAFETWRTWQNERLMRVITRSFQRTIDRTLRGDVSRDPVALSQQLLKIEPLDESAHRAIMITHWRNGNHAAAIEQYQACLNLLQNELAAEPSDQTRSLYERIQRGDAPTTQHLPSDRSTIPQKRRLIGREEELSALLERIDSEQYRLVTLLGPGGIGKSRLAIEAVRKAADWFPDGAFFCTLASVPSREFLLPAVSSTLGFYVDSWVTMLDPKSQLLDFLSTRKILLALDGFEHLTGCADLLADFLAHAPHLMLLVTSRERLKLSDEWEMPLEGLHVHKDEKPGVDPRSPAFELFELRMAQASGDRQLDGPERTAAQEICSLVEGNPLAIELAAAWSGALAPSKILNQMQVSLDVLTTRHRDLPEQHRSLRAVFDHSWDLLPDHLQSTLTAIAVFRGTFIPEAAEAVAGATWVDLTALADRSLVRCNPLGRYELHALLKEYAVEKLLQDARATERVQSAHARYYLELLSRTAPEFLSTGMLAAREGVAKELANIWLALEWAIQHFDDECVYQAMDDLFSFYVVHGWQEGAVALEYLVGRISASRAGENQQQYWSRPLYRAAIARQAWFLAHLGRTEECQSLSERCLAWMSTDDIPDDRSICLNNLGICACLLGQSDKGIEYLEQAIAVGQGYARPVFPSYYLWLGYIRFLQGLYAESMTEYQICYDLFETQGNQPGMAFALSKMGLSADGMGSYDQGLVYHRRALEIFRATNHLSGQAYTYSRMSVDAYGLGDYGQSVEWAEQGLKRFDALGHRWGISSSRCRLAFAEIGLGKLEQANGHLLDALSRAQEHQMTPLMLYAILGLACVLLLEGELERARELHYTVAANPQTPKIYLDLAARWLDEPRHIGTETAPVVVPTFEVMQTSPPHSDLDALASQLLEQSRSQTSKSWG